MSSAWKEWLIVIVFFLAFFAFTFFESAWINKKMAIGFTKSFVFSLISNTFVQTVGFFMSFLIFGVMFAVVWDESINQSSYPNAVLWAGVIAAFLVPYAMLLLVKRLLIKFIGITEIARPWLFSSISALLFFVCVVGSTLATLYLVFHFSK
jgi:hypothetical protein